MYADQTIKNRSFLKRFSHSRRFELALRLLAVARNDKVLDYGTGDGYMLIQMLLAHPQPQRIVGYEPLENSYQELQQAISKMSTDRVEITDDLNRFDPQEFDKVCCLEVLEHLTEENQRNVLCTISHLLNDQGSAVVSVPIEIGMAGLLKNFARWILRQQHPNATAVNILKSFLGLRIDRGNQPFIRSHIGFDYRALEKLFASVGFEIKNKLYSPLKGFGSFCNSQVFFVLEKIERSGR